MSRNQPARTSKTPASQERQHRPTTRSEVGKQSTIAKEHGGTQVLLQRPPATVTKEAIHVVAQASQAVTVEKSLEIVQTLLQGCVSCLASMRHMFRMDCYEQKYYMFGDAPQDASNQAPPGQLLVGLKKGMSQRVDRLVGLLENGVADALRRGCLESLHFSIYEDPKCPSDILEQWIFCFSYHTDTSTGTRVAAGIEITEKKHGSKITVSRAKHALVGFIQQLALICHILPTLPEATNMTVEILYTDNRPFGYTAPGFTRPAIGASRFSESLEWENTMTPIPDKFDTGRHGVTLKVAHLRKRRYDSDSTPLPELESTDEAELEVVVDAESASLGHVSDTRLSSKERSGPSPPQRRNTLRTHSSLSIGKSQEAETSSVPLERLSEVNLNASPSTLQVVPSALQQQHRPIADTMETTHTHEANSLIRRSLTEDLQVREQLRHMLQPRSEYVDTQTTQVLTDSANTPQHREQTVARLQFSQATIDRLDDARSAHLPRRKDTCLLSEELGISKAVNDVNDVTCQCGSLDVDASMVSLLWLSIQLHCGFCNSLQHVACYGYNGTDDERIPHVHICYACILRGEDGLLVQLTYHALCRRALYMLRNQNFDSEKQFAQALGCSTRDCTTVLKDFRRDGLLDGSRRAKQLMLNKSPDMTTRMVRIYFDPADRIAHHLHSPKLLADTSSDASTKRARDNVGETGAREAKRPKVGSRVSEDFDLGNWRTPRPERNR
ncbi:hypothetical protein P153DRAFT_365875 [Dothidotthia symphoricarpi CBS 119687]|uniref:HORMA domain-containing protein n=1 Tax=Dothidotthia symphoricarpi CBS 119687 TaxID=1392245 RepID=A0A6A6AH80_9PLEO|nr:uncharacterized protein P153DRAFT_365875 [Dothidotthia symphoricarpi CBS 119687]KAF2130247.1 hypothetical protein P153DRAFT_365875 [Dothidotthia symphoricarpi CBS 119687]